MASELIPDFTLLTRAALLYLLNNLYLNPWVVSLLPF